VRARARHRLLQTRILRHDRLAAALRAHGARHAATVDDVRRTQTHCARTQRTNCRQCQQAPSCPNLACCNHTMISQYWQRSSRAPDVLARRCRRSNVRRRATTAAAARLKSYETRNRTCLLVATRTSWRHFACTTNVNHTRKRALTAYPSPTTHMRSTQRVAHEPVLRRIQHHWQLGQRRRWRHDCTHECTQQAREHQPHDSLTNCLQCQQAARHKSNRSAHK
jgi:hypothetical protein